MAIIKNKTKKNLNVANTVQHKNWFNNIIKKIKLWHAAIGMFVALTSAYSGAAAIGLDLPRFAWLSELRKTEVKLNGVQLRMERLQAESLQRAWLDIAARIAELEAKKIKIPQLLKTQEEMVKLELQFQSNFVRELEMK